jgi:hypothetical protein
MPELQSLFAVISDCTYWNMRPPYGTIKSSGLVQLTDVTYGRLRTKVRAGVRENLQVWMQTLVNCPSQPSIHVKQILRGGELVTDDSLGILTDWHSYAQAYAQAYKERILRNIS